jgi:hypothetical protein
VAQEYAGWIDVMMSEPNNPQRDRLRLHEPGARPLRPGDEIKIQVELNRSGYCYILWFDAEGKPLSIYPWQGLHWPKRPAHEEPVAKLWLPLGQDVYRIGKSPPGLETLLLLVRDTPLPADQDLRALLGDVEPQAYANLNYVAWFKNGHEVDDEENRAPEEIGQSSNPAVRLQARIQERLGPWFAFNRAVVFGNKGTKTEK